MTGLATRDSLARLTFEVLGRFMFASALVLILFLGSARAVADVEGHMPQGIAVPLSAGAFVLVLGAWVVLVRMGIRTGRARGMTREDVRAHWYFERGLDLIFVGCVVAETLRFVALDSRVVHVCFGGTGIFLAVTRLALARGLGVSDGTWPLVRVGLIGAVMTIAFVV